MNDLIYVAAVMGVWWLMSSTMRDLGLSWRTLTLVALLYGTSAATLWVVHVRAAEGNTEADTLCKAWGGLKKIQSTSEERSSMSHRRIGVECKDGSWISRTVYK